MAWLLIAITSYFFYAIGSLIDRYFLAGPLPKPRFFAAASGILSIFVIFFIPFGFFVPNIYQIILALLTGSIWILSLWALFDAIFHSEVSRVVPGLGAFIPIFTLLGVFLVSGGKEVLSLPQFLALILLICGGVLIILERGSRGVFRFNNLWRLLLAGLLFASAFILMKFVYSSLPFINGFIWINFGAVLLSLLLFLFGISESRSLVLEQKSVLKDRILFLFLFGKASGGLGFILQNVAVSLAKFAQVSLINALAGVQYMFLFFFVFVLAKKSPRLLKEKMTGFAMLQKIIATFIIISGIFLLTVF